MVVCALLGFDLAEHPQRAGDFRIRTSALFFSQRQRFVQHRVGGIEQRQALIDRADHFHHVGLHFRLLRQLAVNAGRAAVEQFARRDGLAFRAPRIGDFKQAAQKIRHFGRFRRFQPGAVALFRQTRRIKSNQHGNQQYH